MNLYYKQIKKLGLNTKQYAKLIDMPYDVVLDLLNERVSYKMSVTDLLRKNLFEKHQEIENDMDNAKLKALELKNENIDYLEWYNNEYTVDLLKEKANVKSIKEFQRKYKIMIDGKKASVWFYSCIVGKTKYYGHQVRESVLIEFAKQLYDIIVNGNKEKYLATTLDDLRKARINNKYEKWYKDFDMQKFLKENDLSNNDIAKELGIAYSTFCLMTTEKNTRHYSMKNLIKLYDYVMDKEKLNNDASSNDLTSDIMNNSTRQIELAPIFTYTHKEEPTIEPLYDDVLRKILINRLTDEEKELIRIFGGKLD